MFETELYKPLKDFAKKNNYTIWAEVANKAVRQSRAIDSVIFTGTEYWSVELKTSLKLDVIEQAIRNLKYFNKSIIAVPATTKMYPGRSLAFKIIKDYNLSLIEIYRKDESSYEIPADNPFTIESKSHERTLDGRRDITKWLFQEQKKSTGGSSSHDEFTRKKDALKKIHVFLQMNGIGTLNDLLEASGKYFGDTKQTFSAIKKYGQSFCRQIEIDGITLFEYFKKNKKADLDE